MIKLYWNKKKIDFESVTWSGTDQQSSRELAFSVPYHPYDKTLNQNNIKLGDLISLYDDSKLLFIGTVTSREKTAEIGTATFTAKDFMHHLLRSNGSYKFKDTTPEKATKKVCGDAKIPVGKLAKSGAKISKAFFEDSCLYDIVVRVYRSAKAVTGKKYMPIMDGKKVSVIEKGLDSGVKLTQGVNVTNATYTDTTDNIVNTVKIYDDKLKNKGSVKSQKSIDKYGVYQSTYTKEEGVNAKSKAKEMLVGVIKEASIEALGDVRAIAGRSIKINDKATSLDGTFYITSDSHTFENGTHTMSLELSYSNTMEEGAETQQDNEESKPEIKNSAKCYYLDNSSVYHSSKSCSALKGKSPKTSKVATIKKIKTTKGKNKGKRKYKPCSKCWNTLGG
jgi:hypothetical protein